jgi:hypothetical protein
MCLRLDVLRLDVLRLDVLRLGVLRLDVLRLDVLRLDVLQAFIPTGTRSLNYMAPTAVTSSVVLVQAAGLSHLPHPHSIPPCRPTREHFSVFSHHPPSPTHVLFSVFVISSHSNGHD